MPANPLLALKNQFLGTKSVLDSGSPLEDYSISLTQPEHPGNERAEDAIDELSKELYKLSLDIHAHPELAWKEKRTMESIANFLTQHTGFQVTKSVYGMETALEATFEHRRGGRTVGFQCEMDALPGLGHANAHNLSTISGLAAAIGVAEAMKKCNLPGRVILLATPGHEMQGGKINLLRAGAYRQMDVCLVTAAGVSDSLSPMWALSVGEALFQGRTAHSGVAPHEALNAMDAAICGYNAVSMLRQQIPPEARLHMVTGLPNDSISGYSGSESSTSPGQYHSTSPARSTLGQFSASPPTGGSSSIRRHPFTMATIPSEVPCFFAVRTLDLPGLQAIKKKLEGCLAGAAQATECEVTSQWTTTYFEVRINRALGLDYARFMQDRFRISIRDNGVPAGSTDFGNVSFELPCLHVVYDIGAPNGVGPHTPGFARAARSREAHEATIKAAKGISTTGLRLLADNAFARECRESFEADKRRRARNRPT